MAPRVSCSERGCPYEPVEDGKCRQHLIMMREPRLFEERSETPRYGSPDLRKGISVAGRQFWNG